MSNNDIPPGWSLSDDMVKKVSEALNRKSITPEEELQDAFDEMARDIALIEPNPQDWAGWVIYFLDQLKEESKRRRRGFDFNSILDELVIGLQNRKINNW
jgi:hypothetical protein